MRKVRTTYMILFTCSSCGHTLYIFKSKIGIGLTHISLKKIHETYGRCPRCGKELSRKPKKIEFKTLKEYQGMLEEHRPS